MSKQLKEARRLLSVGDTEGALDTIDSVLEDEPEDLYALLLKGACLQKLHRDEEGISTLRRVTNIDPNNLVAWKGLSRLYFYKEDVPSLFESYLSVLRLLAAGPANMQQDQIESEARKTFEDMRNFVQKLAQRLRKSQRASKYASDANTGSEYVDKLLLLQITPTSATPQELIGIHEFLASLSPPVLDPNALQELIYHRETSLHKKLAAIEARKKQTIGYTAAKALADRVDAVNASQLTDLLRVHISTENDDDVRRDAESQLLELLVMELEFVVGDKKQKSRIAELRGEIHDLAERMAMFEPSRALAWELAWDWDPPSLEATDYPLTKTAPKQKSAKKWKEGKNAKEDNSGEQANSERTSRTSEQIEDTLATDSPRSSREDLGEPLTRLKLSNSKALSPEMAVVRYSQVFATLPLGKVLNAFLTLGLSYNEASRSYLAYRGDSVFGQLLCAKFFVTNRAYESAIDSVHAGLQAASKREAVFGMDMDEAVIQLKMIQALSYTHFQAPKNFGLATDLYDEVLKAQPDNTDAVVGKGLILSQQGSQDEAKRLLEQALVQDPSNELALGELSWLLVRQGEQERGIEGLKRCLALHNTPARNAELHFRIGYALWSAGEYERSFSSFVDSLSSSKNYAPAFTYLGLFYDDIAKDKARAHRCFYKALELDNGELLAGERLAADFATNSQWDLVEVVASTVLASSKLAGSRDVDWPYRAMGIVCLNQLRYEDAVKYFQRCLRSRKSDVQAWIGLGEAYIHAGRYHSAEKALSRAIKIDPENFSAYYVLSLAHREMLDFPASSKSLEMAIKYAPLSSAALQWALADNSLRAASFLMGESQLGQAVIELEKCLKAVISSIDTEETGLIWGSAAEALLLLNELGYTKDGLPEGVQRCVNDIAGRVSSNWKTLLDLAELFALRFVELTAKEPKPRRVAAHTLAAETLRSNNKLDKALDHYKAAIALESRNESLWNAYGVALQEDSPLVAQHCFIRALTLNGRNADTWANLSGLYLIMGDAELAHEAVDRALSLEPEHTRAWIAQVLADTMLNSKTTEQLRRTLEYAQQLASNDALANFTLALKEYEQRTEKPSPASVGALTQLLAMQPRNRDAKLIMGLLLERLGDFESSLENLQSVAAWPHVARVQLALADYSGALEACSRVLEGTPQPLERLSALLTAGLAHYFSGDLNNAIEKFMDALAQSESNEQLEEDVLVLLVQVLYASANAEARQAAQDQLFASIDAHGPKLQTTLLLGVIGFLEHDAAVMEAARQELELLVTPDVHGEPLAQACHLLTLLNPSNKAFQRAVFQWPTDYSLWRRVDKTQALLVAEGHSNDAEQLSRALLEAPSVVHSQRAVFYEPLNAAAWESLAQQLSAS